MYIVHVYFTCTVKMCCTCMYSTLVYGILTVVHLHTCTRTCTCMPLPQYASELHVFIIHTVTFALYLGLKIAQDQLLDTKQELNQVTMKSGTEDKRIITLTDDLNTLQDQLSLLTVAKDKYMYDAVSQDLEESVSL